MSTTIEKLMHEDISDTDIHHMIKDVQVKSYHELASVKFLDQLFAGNKACILLYEQIRNTGHFTVLRKLDEQTVEYFDPLAFPIDGLLKFWHETIPPYLTDLINQSNFHVLRNKTRVQNLLLDTCGRHCVTRLYFPDMSLHSYCEMILKKKPSADYFVTEFTQAKLR